MTMKEPDPLLTPREVAALMKVAPKTVTRWAKEGKIGFIKTLGGHHRFKSEDVAKLMMGPERDG
jgi:excisionase family DNA binding protein